MFRSLSSSASITGRPLPLPDGRAFTPAHLDQDFGAGSQLARTGVRALYGALLALRDRRARGRFHAWKKNFGEASGHDLDTAFAKLEPLASAYDLGPCRPRPAELLFSLHSYFALVLKLLAAQVVASARGRGGPPGVDNQASTDAFLLDRMRAVETATVFSVSAHANGPAGDPFAWYLSAWLPPVVNWVRALATRLDAYDPNTLRLGPHAGHDLLKGLYQGLFPKPVRRHLGEHYTPDWLADYVLDGVGYDGDPDRTFLDPACGSGTFLVRAIWRVLAWYEGRRPRPPYDEKELCRRVFANVTGLDLNPLAVIAARTNYLIALGRLLAHAEPVAVPVFLRDALLARAAGVDGVGDLADARREERGDGRCDVGRVGRPVGEPNSPPPATLARAEFVVGNPPWINWDDLPAGYRERTKSLWRRNGLFSLRGARGRSGGAKKDLSMLFVYEGLRNLVTEKGRLGFVLPQTLFKTEGAADGFRRFSLPAVGAAAESPFRVRRVDDLNALRPFAGATNRTAVLFADRDGTTRFPVEYRYWVPRGRVAVPEEAGLAWVLRAAVRRLAFVAEPVEPDHPTGPWLTVPQALRGELRKAMGRSAYQAQAGVTTCGADGVFLVRTERRVSPDAWRIRNVPDAGRSAVPERQGEVLGDFLYPVCRGRDIARWSVRTEYLVLLAQDPEARRGLDESSLRRHAGTWKFLSSFRKELEARRSKLLPRPPFYSIYGVDRRTLAPFKVVWGRVGKTVAAGVVGTRACELGPRPVVPFEAMLLPLEREEEAHFVCAALNSLPAQLIVAASIALHPDTHVLRRVRVPRFEPANPRHLALAALSRSCHLAAEAKSDAELARQEAALDLAAMDLWGLDCGAASLLRACLRHLL
ncbi:MAG: hypothetical protein HYZ53_27585 [Planctomycetes bacterium]|nr:hypothetical protein [Planctomycetota bacterium]